MRALLDGFRGLFRNAGLIVLVLALNAAVALVAALPVASLLREDLSHTGASTRMMYGFDYDWWRHFDHQAGGLAGDFAPDLLGTGFAWRNLDLLVQGVVPAGLFSGFTGADAALLALAALYWLLQVFLTGGLLATFRAPAGGWTFRGLVHACGFHFARLLRVALLAVAGAAVLFAAWRPLTAWTDRLAREAVSERTALVLVFGRAALLLLALLLLHLVSSYAKVILVCEERRSAVLAFVSSLGFCARQLGAVLLQYLVVGLAGIALVGLFGVLDRWLPVSGWTTQLLALALFEAFVAAQIALRLGLLAGQVELQQAGDRPRE
ncbi:MAG TPA: hypothetical protein VMX54_08710 [Vicinamibacteria bacterium]|nr:hypothetical protein [Vicinamibacteria bacterium]